MIRYVSPLALLALAACVADPASTPAPTENVTRTDAVPLAATQISDTAPRQCWATEITPATYEQVMGEVLVVQAEMDENGVVTRPPIYRKAPVPRVVQPRGEMKFEAPCPEQMPPEFIASVQRALAARGYFAGNVTGVLDAPTAAAVRKYQSERGLDSAQVSLETARALGLVAIERPQG